MAHRGASGDAGNDSDDNPDTPDAAAARALDLRWQRIAPALDHTSDSSLAERLKRLKEEGVIAAADGTLHWPQGYGGAL